MKQHVIITRGLPASGKSTWSSRFVVAYPEYKRISRDDLRFMIHGGYMVDNDKAVIDARNTLIEVFLAAGYNLVLDETYLAPNRVKELKEILKNWDVEIEIRDFLQVSLKACLMRNKRREGNYKVPEQFIKDYYNKYVIPLLDKQKKSMI